MKKFSVKLASLALFLTVGAAIGMEAPQKLIIRNIAWGYAANQKGWDYYAIKVAINDSTQWVPENGLEGGATIEVGNLHNVNQVKVRRSGAGSSWIPSALGESYITQQELDEIKQEANENIGKDLVLAIGATTTGFGLYAHYWLPSSINKEENLPRDSDLPEEMQIILNFLQTKSSSASEKTKDAINQILKRDNTRDKRFQKRLAEVIQLYTTEKNFESNVNKILVDLKRLRTLPRK
jgi:hypothetical protein